MNDVVIWGASGHALVVADILRLMGNYAVVGYLDDLNPDRVGERYGGGAILGGREQLVKLIDSGVTNLALGIGDCRARMRLAKVAVKAGFSLVTAIHPSAIIAASARIGAGTTLCAGSIVGAEASIGDVVIVNTSASVDHECSIADGVHLSPGVHLAGKVKVGAGASLGTGSVARDGVCVGEDCVIGAGAAIVCDLPANVLAFGVPAKEICKTATCSEKV